MPWVTRAAAEVTGPRRAGPGRWRARDPEGFTASSRWPSRGLAWSGGDANDPLRATTAVSVSSYCSRRRRCAHGAGRMRRLGHHRRRSGAVEVLATRQAGGDTDHRGVRRARPFLDAARVFAPQKGAPRAGHRPQSAARIARRGLSGPLRCRVTSLIGAGAGWARRRGRTRAKLTSGSSWWRAARVARCLEGADLVVTGEGRLDAPRRRQRSWRGGPPVPRRCCASPVRSHRAPSSLGRPAPMSRS